ncbi:endonuclease V isoform X1 [Pongo abelii]|uniref:endonuclease V isoform X1 n=1 Tax=Pongo abelii TaxID=9601 RepID=UPI0030043727
MEPATLALLLMETRSRRALTDLIPGNPPADQVLGGSSYGPDPRESSYGPGPGGSSYGLDSRESFYRLGSRGSSYGLDPRESSYSPDPGESSYGPDPRESSYRPDPGESSYGPGPGGSSYRPDTRWCTRRAAWSASQPPTCRASWPSERCPSCWSWCSSCGRRSRASCPRQVLLVDGNGVLHHRGFGVACHLGVLTDLPCVGVAKKLLQVDGLENNALHKEKIRLLQTRGDSFPLLGDSGTVLGMALRSHDRSTRPLYVSVGHKMSLEAAVRLICCCCRFRIPEPVRQADICSREHIRKSLGLPGSPTPRSPKAQRPVACPRGDSRESSGEGQPPQDHSPGPRTAPRPGSQEQAGKDWQ